MPTIPNISHTSNGYGFKGNDFVMFTNAGIPTASTGAGYAGKGSICVDLTNAKIYINGGTKATPSWKIVTSA